jgi:hypothetical protein
MRPRETFGTQLICVQLVIMGLIVCSIALLIRNGLTGLNPKNFYILLAGYWVLKSENSPLAKKSTTKARASIEN